MQAHSIRFKGPRYGISGVRNWVGTDRPIFGSIIKPKTGISPSTFKEMVEELVDGVQSSSKKMRL